MKHITSIHNPLIQELAKLTESKERAKQQKFIAQGLRTCKTIIQAGYIPLECLVTEDQLSIFSPYCPDDSLILVSLEVLKKISSVSTPSGVACTFRLPALPSSDQLQAGLVLAQIADPGNMGTLIRTSVALGRTSIVIVEGADPWSPKVVQSTAGTLAYAKIFRWSWQELITHKGSLNLCALVVKNGKKPNELDLSRSLLVVGSEAHGIPAPWLAQCDTFMTLSMPGGTESLNAAVAGSIALYLAWIHSSRA